MQWNLVRLVASSVALQCAIGVIITPRVALAQAQRSSQHDSHESHESQQRPQTEARQAATLSGHVTDPQGAAVAGTNVRLSREDGGVRHTVTDEAGAYAFASVLAGTVVIEVEKPGFRRQVQVATLSRDRGGAALNVDVQLDIAGIDDGVVVTATGRPQDAREASKAVTTIDAQEIADRNESALTEIIRFTPGVQVRDNGGPGQAASMRIRGLRADAAAVLIDGMRFRDASTTQSDASSFLSNLNFVSAERVEVLRGSGSSLYGTNAVGGVVNIVTRGGGGPLHGDAQAEAGSLGFSRMRGSVGGGALADRLSFSAGALQLNLRDGLDGHDATRSSGGQGMVRYQINANTSLMGRVFGSDDRVDLNVSPTASGIPAANVPNAIIVDAVPVPVAQIARANQGLPFDAGNATFISGRDDPDSRRSSAFVTTAVQLRQVATPVFSWQASYQRVHSTRTFLNGPLGVGFQPAADNYSHYTGNIDTVDVRGFLLPTPWLSVTAGYEFEREGYFDRQDNNLAGTSRLRTETRISQQAHAAFGEAQFGLLGRRLQISLSGRVQGFRLSSPDFSAAGTRNAYEGLALEAPSRALTGDVSAAYSIAASNTKLRVHGGNAYRAPSLYERFGGGFSTDPVSGVVLFTPYGDPRLRPDRYQSIDGGVDQYFWHDRLLATATVFYTNVSSLTAFDSSGKIRPETDPFDRSMGYLNGTGGFARGVETGLEARPTASLRASASYTYTRSQTSQDITVPGFYIVPGVFGHTATFAITQRWSDRLDTTFDLFHGSSAFGSFFAAGRTRAYRYPGFTKAAIVAGYRVSPSAAKPIRAYVKVDNLFDEEYYQGGWRALGRTAMVGVSAGF